MAQPWEDFCVKRLGMSWRCVDRVIRQCKEPRPGFSKLSCFTRIKPAEYGLTAAAVPEDALAGGGELIAWEPEKAPKPSRPWKRSAAIAHRNRPTSIPPKRPCRRPVGRCSRPSRNSSGCKPWTWVPKGRLQRRSALEDSCPDTKKYQTNLTTPLCATPLPAFAPPIHPHGVRRDAHTHNHPVADPARVAGVRVKTYGAWMSPW